ncbi:hypothetical protein [Rhodalgimonas zhirmunskyi]|uniref:EF-hand domain-containing protein n=1 Tax=Rhodalgimonas zhirmunskyi TaxID=2964767 RepID=A0AAJ1U312_9RHOB|nr:hypothetical protein [Rhodoalgimonas zhirmunskyi]MDQ2092725.1 hypothetical protein [Rhodoalgimonas zhirmunskyi]
MKRIALTLAATLLGTAAMAATEVDANGDGMVTIEEVQATYPEVSADDFSAMDTNADGALDDAEMQAAEAAGLLKS